jgi:transcriptional regulator GlxA family with amidase domain
MRAVVSKKSHPSGRRSDHSRALQPDALLPRLPSAAVNRHRDVGNPCVGRFPETTVPRTVGVIVFEQMTATDLSCPAEVFSRANIPREDGRGRDRYYVVTVGTSTEPCLTESGIVVHPQVDMLHAPPFDTVVIPGGNGMSMPKLNKKIATWLKDRTSTTRRFAALGTGIYPLASTGLLNRRLVAVHWRLAKDVASRFPELHVKPNSLFLKDGPFYTSAGATAGIDLSLSLIEEDYGPRVAMEVARELVVYLKRAGGEEQYSEPLQFQTQSVSRMSDLATWIASHLSEDLSIEVLAARACLCPRHFSRRFKIEFGQTPADLVEKLRLDEARRRLSDGDNSIENIGISVGFKSADAFRRAFERRFGINPSHYRQQFRPFCQPNGKRPAKQLEAAA